MENDTIFFTPNDAKRPQINQNILGERNTMKAAVFEKKVVKNWHGEDVEMIKIFTPEGNDLEAQVNRRICIKRKASLDLDESEVSKKYKNDSDDEFSTPVSSKLPDKKTQVKSKGSMDSDDELSDLMSNLDQCCQVVRFFWFCKIFGL